MKSPNSKNLSFEHATKWGLAAAVVAGLGAAALWAINRNRKGAVQPETEAYRAPQLQVGWEQVDQMALKMPSNVAVVPALHPQDSGEKRGFMVISTPAREPEGDGDLAWRTRELIIAMSVGNDDWRVAHTGRRLGELYPMTPEGEYITDGAIHVALPLGEASVRAFVVDGSEGLFQGEDTHVTEIMPREALQQYYPDTPVVRG